MPHECILSDDEYYGLLKSLHNCIKIYPGVLPGRRDLLTRLADLYRETEDEGEIEFVVTRRAKEGEGGEANHEHER